ncbi:MAG: helix-turn-helix domain-containing protein [Chloroflexota bacterium]
MSKKTDLILHPVRMRLVAELSERQMTSRQLAEMLPDVPQATLYRHIKRLVQGGIFEVVAEQAVNGATERTYAVVAGQNRLHPDEIAALSEEEHVKLFSVFAAGLIDSFARYVQKPEPVNFEEDGVSYNRTVIYLDVTEREALAEAFMGALRPFMGNLPTAERQRYTLASVVIPDERGNR